ncbi:MAG: cysteine--tRNA ligase [Telmatospirillum sp.]|nr:cysteine--tRNA ligase [Telmatospirillum sp.]
MTALHVHNTMTRRKEKFEPLDPAHVKMYVCGPTVYDDAHIGNARPVVVFDVLARLLRRLYPKVTYARNITDIDDKIIVRAAERGVHIDTVTADTIANYHADMAALGALPPDMEPRCTRSIPGMLAMIETLVDKGHAYAAEGHVLFAVASYADYGKLSGRSRDEQIAGARVEVAPFKRDPADFVLWKPSTPDQPGWDSKWGRGRPGWHIECSAMAKDVLGITIDIHGGGLDLTFPHHENEIAQSQCAHGGVQFSKYWMHNGFLVVNGEKMSKSLGNFFTVRDLRARAPGEAIRLLLLKTHYRAPLDFTDEGLRQAKLNLDRWYRLLQISDALLDSSQKEADRLNPMDVPPDILRALCDDLNTSEAIARIGEFIVDKGYRHHRDGNLTELRMAADELRSAAAMLGLLQVNPEAWFKQTLNATGIPSRNSFGSSTIGNTKPLEVHMEEYEIDTAIAARLAARKAKNFAEADRIRDDLKAKGIVLEDGPKGTSWKRDG